MKWLYSDIDDSIIRVAFRIYFICTLALLGVIGSQCCKCAAKLDLLHGKSVQVHRMTGWVRARDVLICLWKLRQLPGGWWLGLVMVIASFLTLTTDLATTALVRQQYRWDLCYFEQGLVVDWTHKELFTSPPSNGYPALLASNAQFDSDYNNCGIGVYRKIPYPEDPTFCAGKADIIGNWNCEDVDRDATVPSDYAVDEIGTLLYDNDLQYANGTASYIHDNSGQTTHFATWSSSATDDALASFDVLASIDLNVTVTQTKTIKTFKCSIASGSSYDTEALETILSTMPSNQALRDWAPGLEAAIYHGAGTNASDNTSAQLELLLNSLTMVFAGSNSITSSAVIDNDVPYYGCMLLKTIISPGIIILVIVAGLTLCITALYWVILLTRLGRAALPSIFHGSSTGLRNLKPVPDSILSWILQASRENALGGQYGEDRYLVGLPMKERDLQDWSLSVVDHGNGIARMARSNGSVAPPVEQIHVYGK